MKDELEDRRLVKRLLAHDREAFSAFFDGYFPRLYRFARTRLSNDSGSAKEVVQVTLTKAVRKLASYRGEAPLFTWLCAICRNEIAEHRERVARDKRHVVLSDDAREIRAVVEATAAPDSDDPELAFRELETTRSIHAALDQLPTHLWERARVEVFVRA
jgi:RNA polymerase sigma-70 factor (ECF subfamily)